MEADCACLGLARSKHTIRVAGFCGELFTQDRADAPTAVGLARLEQNAATAPRRGWLR
jgi:hypothetical protein